ncbi:hypothetical protein [Roseomonas sp. BN140053]|uniref:hypothetical protein n=1 Tax=Roseomonas sp. BN140053 TaxID=3391898 RepID=UPI0039ECED8C
MRLKTQGYIVLALGPARYREMAANLAASIKVMDPGRPVCLVHDVGVTLDEEARALFDHTVALESDPRFPHVMNKIRLFELSPYTSTMFVDADCLLVKRDVDHYWNAVSSRPFSITGGKRRTGEWKGVRIEDVLRQEGAPYLIQMNAGIFHFDASEEAGTFFRELGEYYLSRMDRLNITNYKGPQSQSFELYLGLFMGLKGMNSDNVGNTGGNSWMVSSWRALRCDFDPRQGRSTIYKGDGHVLGLPFLPTRVVKLSPTFAHFIALKPRRVYARLAEQFRAMAAAQREGHVAVTPPARTVARDARGMR